MLCSRCSSRFPQGPSGIMASSSLHGPTSGHYRHMEVALLRSGVQLLAVVRDLPRLKLDVQSREALEDFRKARFLKIGMSDVQVRLAADDLEKQYTRLLEYKGDATELLLSIVDKCDTSCPARSRRSARRAARQSVRVASDRRSALRPRARHGQGEVGRPHRHAPTQVGF